MTKEEIAAIFERAQTWPVEKQQEAAAILGLENEEEDDGSDLTREDQAELDEASAAIDRGEFETAEDMKAFFAKIRSCA
jgi:hypothetical protein